MITPKGYKILLSHERTNEFKKDLVVVPYVENSVRYPIFRISENYLYMPKFYGIDKLGLPELSSTKEQTGINYEFKFTGKLRDYQVPICNKILKHLNVNGSGLASLYTGWGKTCASLWILSQLGKKTLIIVHTENLLNQWKDRIKDFLGEEPGIIQGPKIEIDNHKIVIGMIQSISMKEYPPNTFKEFGFTIYDECFPSDTYIHTNIGKLTIYKLFHIWNKEGISNNIEILSFNRETRVFEYKPLTYAWRKINYDLIKLTLSKQTIKCTLNHKILTSNGYVEADKLNIGDIVLSCNKNKFNNELLETGTLIITNKEYTNNETGEVYDIEVKDNHNFIIARQEDDNQYVDGPIVSNCHHTPGKAFSKIFYKIGTKYNLGLSATITRADGLTKVIKYFIGAVIVNLKLSTMTPKITFKYSSMEPLKEKTMVNGKINIAAMINDLCYSFTRSIEIVNIIKEKYKEGRKILILTDRRAHCTELKRLLGSDFENDIGLYLGSMKNEALQESNTKQIIIATYAMASEGYDNPELDTLILASPKSKIEQAVGRILRQENKNEPEVIDFVDSFSVFNNFYYARIKFYKSKKYIDKNKNINNDNDPNSNNDTKIESYSFIE